MRTKIQIFSIIFFHCSIHVKAGYHGIHLSIRDLETGGSKTHTHTHPHTPTHTLLFKCILLSMIVHSTIVITTVFLFIIFHWG
ncbi:rCG25491 [Rattus norvegicus]|uniref:RCG25491 n=1 Tax=Rattus norvegicus TaxID=10116 RepID=A6I1G0_RAT|nr:rCG25491 [Rattus norvegicus]